MSRITSDFLWDDQLGQVFRAAHLVREMEHEDIRVLMGIELGMRRFTYVPMDQISFYARIDRSNTQYRLDRLDRFGLLQRNSEHNYIGYQLISESYDVLALNALVEKGIIDAVGESIGRGKESDVFFGKCPDGSQVALKFHRIGQNSFRKVRQLRSYVEKRSHISWLYVSRLSAEREFEGLQKVYKLGLNTPKPIAQNRHIVVMSLINGNELNETPIQGDPMPILDEILNQVERYFVQGKIIHCDLGEFNILLTEDQKVIFIDWPQWESADHPNAMSYLGRDLFNINTYFEKNYGINFDVDQYLDRLFGQDRPPLNLID